MHKVTEPGGGRMSDVKASSVRPPPWVGAHSQAPRLEGSHQGGLTHNEDLGEGPKIEEPLLTFPHGLSSEIWDSWGSPVRQASPWRWKSTEQMAPKWGQTTRN